MAPAGDGGGGIPAEPRAGLGGPATLAGSSGNARATGGNGSGSGSGSGMDSLAIAFDLLPSPVRGPVWTFFGHDCMGQGQLWYAGSMNARFLVGGECE